MIRLEHEAQFVSISWKSQGRGVDESRKPPSFDLSSNNVHDDRTCAKQQICLALTPRSRSVWVTSPSTWTRVAAETFFGTQPRQGSMKL